MSASRLDTPLVQARLPGLSAGVAAKLAKGLGVHTVRDLIEQVPRRYIDLSKTRTIGDLKIGEDATTVGTVAKVDGRHFRPSRHILTVTISDGTGYLQLVWWNQPFRARAFARGASVAVAGRVERNRGRLQITNPFVETVDANGGPGVHVGRIIPVHPATHGVTPTQIRRFVHAALQRYASDVTEVLPGEVLDGRGMMGRADAIAELHFPTSQHGRMRARERMVFEELFVLSAGLAMRKRRIEQEARGFVHGRGDDDVARFLASVGFAPTRAQSRVGAEIAADMARSHPMNRLLQGEVGSGKTLVAVAAALRAHASGSQTAFMAPTEVLAEQHFRTVQKMLAPLADLAPAEGRLFSDGLEVHLLTGSVTGAARTKALEAAASGRAMMLVGTHALIQEGVSFRRLGLAIVDEQHRFGVHQRVTLRGKGASDEQPDLLIMTATPIPRTLAMTLYGDVDVSTLDEMPPGRTPVETAVVADELGRRRAYRDIATEAEHGRQAFIVCPLVEDSTSLEAKAAETEYERIRTDVFPDLRVGLIHGRMRPKDKDAVMQRMHAGELDVLVSTTVIEVGVDIPNATVMIVEDADRFGLSQLHQLRGRIGRGRHAARCYLFTTLDADAEGRELALKRLDAMASTADGFALAEIDLELRGTGQLFGRAPVDAEGKGAPAQAGRGDLRFANLLRDVSILSEARAAAFDLVDRDAALTAPEHAALLDDVKRRFADRLDWLFAS